jgi:aspartate/tyrosine/aromatic aminotransferase
LAAVQCNGSALGRIILDSAELGALWRDELESMRRRLRGIRDALAEQLASLALLVDSVASNISSVDAILVLPRHPARCC